MPIQCVLFCRDKPPIQIEIDLPAELPEAVGLWPLPAAVMVRVAELKDFGTCAELFKNRDKKDEHKGLSEYLLGQGDCIPFIDANYTDYGRLIQQRIGSLLANAEEAGEQGVYLLGVSGEHFLKSWNDAITEDAALQLAPKGSGLSSVLPPLRGEVQLRKYFWGYSEAYHQVRQLILYAAKVSTPVLILGKAGTGKGVVAQAIHDLEQKDKPFIEVNCAAIPSDVFELEIFGYAPGGKFVGALLEGKAGKWESAGDGTLFLDEIGELRLDHQAKILHAMQEGCIWRAGALTQTQVSARVIAATSRDLYGMVQRGEFLKDLYYALRQFLIRTPDLRDDRRNLEVIAQKLWRENTNPDARLPKEILDELWHHPWPGNVRELRSVLRSLTNYFGSSAPTREQLNAVFHHFGLAAGYGTCETDASEPAEWQLECLRKICHADDAIHACELELKPLAKGIPLKAVAWESLTRLSMEMQTLMSNRLYFGSQETYQAVAHVGESLGKLLELNKKDMHSLSSLWQKSLEPDIQQAVKLLFAEIKNMRALMSAGSGNIPS
jgi:DNA-binding NtrC family response regulator